MLPSTNTAALFQSPKNARATATDVVYLFIPAILIVSLYFLHSCSIFSFTAPTPPIKNTPDTSISCKYISCPLVSRSLTKSIGFPNEDAERLSAKSLPEHTMMFSFFIPDSFKTAKFVSYLSFPYNLLTLVNFFRSFSILEETTAFPPNIYTVPLLFIFLFI